MARTLNLRPARFDELGLRRAISDRLLPLLVAAMAFLGALALAGLMAASQLAQNWRGGAGSVLTVQVPAAAAAHGGVERVAGLLRATDGVDSVRPVPDAELRAMLKPWLGGADAAMPLPAAIDVRLSDPGVPTGPVAARLAAAVPGTTLDAHEAWLDRLTALARSLQACAALVMLIVALVAAAVVAVATRAGLAARRDSIEIVHGLGATDGYIAHRFAGRATLLATGGAAAGALLALPVLLALASLAAPFATTSARPETAGLLASLPVPLWMALPLLPAAAAGIGWATAQGTVRRWLRRLP